MLPQRFVGGHRRCDGGNIAAIRRPRGGLSEVMVASSSGLVERSDDLAVAAELARAACSGDGCLLLVEGPAGIGKTSLLREIVSIASDAGLAALRGIGSELDSEFPFGVARELFAVPARHPGALEGAAALAAPLFGGEGVTADVDGIVHGLYWLCANVAEQTPLAIVVDDAQWADVPTLRALAYLARRLDGLPILLVVASRPDGPDGSREILDRLATDPTQCTLSLAPLSLAATTRIVRGRLGKVGTDELCRACHDVTGGNPFYLHELLTSQPQTPNEARALGPKSIARVVLTRLESLSAEHAAVAEAVAVLGTGATVARVAAVAGLNVDEVGRCADDLVRADLLDIGRPLVFVHAIVARAIYDALGSGRRSALHRRAAVQLDTEGAGPMELAGHLLECDPSGDRWIVERLRSAAAEALATGASEAASTYLDRALTEPPASPADRLTVEHELAKVEARIPRATAVERYERVLGALADPVERARVVLEAAPVLALAGREVAAHGLVDGTLAELPSSNTQLRAELYLTGVAMARLDHRLRTYVPGYLAELIELDASGLPAPVRFGISANLAREAQIAGEAAPVVVEHARAALRADPDPYRSEVYNGPLVYTIIALACVDHFDEALAMNEQMLAVARDRGDLQMVALALQYRAYCGIRSGALSGAEADLRSSLALLEGWEFIYANSLAFLIDVLRERGEYTEAWVLLRERGWDTRMEDVRTFTQNLTEARGRLALATQDAARALPDLLEVGQSREDDGVVSPTSSAWRSAAALALHALGRSGDALEYANLERELAERAGAPRALGIALRTLGVVTGGPDGCELITQAHQLLVDSPARLEAARTAVELGEALWKQRLRDEAQETLREGLDGATRCGATALADRARDLLVATGARPRRAMLTGVWSLTPSERRVCELASQGLTNREIAQSLFLTTKTIEHHLGAAYRKLNISGKADLRGALVDA